jgi:hypothetical protein
MKKGTVIIHTLLFITYGMYFAPARGFRMYNAGIIDYAPLSARCVLSADAAPPESELGASID